MSDYLRNEWFAAGGLDVVPARDLFAGSLPERMLLTLGYEWGKSFCVFEYCPSTNSCVFNRSRNTPVGMTILRAPFKYVSIGAFIAAPLPPGALRGHRGEHHGQRRLQALPCASSTFGSSESKPGTLATSRRSEIRRRLCIARSALNRESRDAHRTHDRSPHNRGCFSIASYRLRRCSGMAEH